MTAIAHTPLQLGSLGLSRAAGEGIAIGIPAAWAIRVDKITATAVRLRAVQPITGDVVRMRLSKGEVALLDSDLRISLKGIRGAKDGKPIKADLRVHANRDVPVYRNEIYDEIIRERAAQGAE